LYNANLNELVSVENDTKINEAIDISIAQKDLYISMPFEEPLYETVSKLSVYITVTASAKGAVYFTR
jgi:2-succinyl-5-enolpyruvyl-6-hydroxy-3-cyclohexene-1-carboxylate synthase